MPDVPRSHLVAYVLAALVVLGFGWRQVAHARGDDAPGTPVAAGDATPAAAASGSGTPSAGAGAAAGSTEAGGGGATPGGGTTPAADGRDVLIVHVAGWVRRPGVYRLADGLRVDDAVRAAGGARRGADLSQLNLAMKLEDGRQILVARRGTTAAGPAGAAPAPGSASGGAGAAPGGAGGAAASNGFGAASSAPVNLNTATVEQLDGLSGVGPVTAANIVAYRDEHGGFGSVDELGEVTGIGPVRLQTLRELVTV